ncbi:MAG: PilZ domain-containing protein [Desulfobacteraceae bacterium]|nr:PilZ domain-containing protein [Desulfobacteraceae bacterium]MBC2756512.1 PilZ domain-containing protein [Desulfobacteraceae bacterium]
MGINKRKHERVDALNLLSYVILDVDGKEWGQGMGRTLNISENGLQLETHEPIDTKNILQISIGIEDELVEIKGKVVYTNRGDSGKFEAGIEFIQVKQDALVVLKKYINEFNKQFNE